MDKNTIFNILKMQSDVEYWDAESWNFIFCLECSFKLRELFGGVACEHYVVYVKN